MSKKKDKQHGTSSEKRRDQPLLLEFDSLFESLQVISLSVSLLANQHLIDKYCV